MRHDVLAPLRHTLLLGLGLGCAVRAPPEATIDGPPPVRPAEPVPPWTRPPDAVPPSSGYIRDDDGTVHRASGQTCSADNPRAACGEAGQHSACTQDSDCSDGPHAKCVQDSGQIGPFCRCDYACTDDSECGPGQLCVCAEALGGDRHSQCVTALCNADTACSDGTCGLSVYHNGCFEALTLACRSPNDTCRRDADCTDQSVCAYNPDATRWECQGMTCAIGRPLVVDGAMRTAAAVPRRDWLAGGRPSRGHTIAHAYNFSRRRRPTAATTRNLARLVANLPAVPASAAAQLAAHWTAIASLEHASVASFARFSLDLLARAAPPELLAAAAQATGDEVAHAQLAWTLASAFAGHAVGPGPLATADVGPHRDLASFVTALVREGCVGETLGAAEAELTATLADPHLAPHLAQVAADETRHATLAWQTLAWLLRTHGAPVAAAARAAVEDCHRELTSIDPNNLPVVARETTAWGLVPAAQIHNHRLHTLHTVIRPVLAVVMDAHANARASHSSVASTMPQSVDPTSGSSKAACRLS